MATRPTPPPARQPRNVSLQHLLLAGAAALPTVRYATASVGIAAAAALAVRSTSSASMAVLGGTVMLASIVLIAIVGRLAPGRDPAMRDSLRAPAVALAWGVVCAAIVVLGLLISTTFWGMPNPVTCCTETPRSTCGQDASR